MKKVDFEAGVRNRDATHPGWNCQLQPKARSGWSSSTTVSAPQNRRSQSPHRHFDSSPTFSSNSSNRTLQSKESLKIFSQISTLYSQSNSSNATHYYYRSLQSEDFPLAISPLQMSQNCCFHCWYCYCQNLKNPKQGSPIRLSVMINRRFRHVFSFHWVIQSLGFLWLLQLFHIMIEI